MASDDASSPSDKPKIEKVRDWLLHVGYPLEMRVARLFTNGSSFNVSLGEVYQSKDRPNVMRDVDVVAELAMHLYRPEAFDGRGVTMLVDLFTVCECKSNPKAHRPWIVFTDAEMSPDRSFRIQSHAANKLGGWLLGEVQRQDRVLQLDLIAKPRVGYSVRCARLDDKKPRENDQDPAYEAVMAVLDAAQAMAAVNSDRYEMFRIVLPLIVIDADLYECWLDRTGELRLEVRDEMALLWKRGPGSEASSYSMVYIVTEAKLREFVDRVEVAEHVLISDEELLQRGVRENWRQSR